MNSSKTEGRTNIEFIIKLGKKNDEINDALKKCMGTMLQRNQQFTNEWLHFSFVAIFNMEDLPKEKTK